MVNGLVNWSKVINEMTGPFPEVGDEAPDLEKLPQEANAKDMIGNLTRLTLDIFIFDNDEIEQAYMMQNESMRIYEDISLKDSMELVKRGKKKTT